MNIFFKIITSLLGSLNGSEVGEDNLKKPRKPKELTKGDVTTESYVDDEGYQLVQLEGVIHTDNVDDMIDWLTRWKIWAEDKE